MTIKFKKPYTKRSGEVGFLYTVQGEQKELDAYVAAKVKQGLPEAKVKQANGEIIWYQNEYKGASAAVELSDKGNYYAVTTDHDIMISMQRQIHAAKTQVEVAA